MLNNRKKPSASFVGRGRKRQVRRLLLETLERRECPAVMFGFERGILSITGDEGANAIEIIQRDSVVEVVGVASGARSKVWTRSSSKPANVDLGADDDRLNIDMSGYANVNGLIAAGDGNDEIHIRHRMFAIVDRSQLKLNVHLGLGSDILVIETFNYRDFETTIRWKNELFNFYFWIHWGTG